MFSLTPSFRLRRFHFFIGIAIFLIFSFVSLFDTHQSSPYSETINLIRNTTSYREFCLEVDRRIAREEVPTKTIQLRPGRDPIPYAYSQWRSTPLMPRLLTTCEHAIYIQLLNILVKYVFEKHNIPYMMMAATLLGSYTHHDILPWDDDIDLRVDISDRQRFQSIVQQELSDPPFSLVLMQMHNDRNYDKVFFSWSPYAGATSWGFPFIDIFYHDQNETHVWLLGTPASCPEPREDVFPFVLRPLGPLWLLAPREPMAHFQARRMVDIETGCYAFPYSHKYERLIRNDILYANCTALRSFYPYVERRCSRNRCIETLKLDGPRAIHRVTYNYAYRPYMSIGKNYPSRTC